MIIKKFIGKTEAEAIEAAKKELGSNVVVMNVKEVKRKGIFASLRSRLVEATVALEEEKNDILQNVSKEPGIVKKQDYIAPDYTAGARDSSKNIEEKLDSLQSLLVNQMQKAENEKNVPAAELSADQENNLTGGDKSVKNQTKEADEEKNEELVKFMKLLYNTMLDNEVDEKYANQILEEIEKLNKPNMSFDYTLANTYQKMILKFGKSASITPAQSGPRVVLFIGPTGVGKTTTIAKVASNFSMSEKKKVALLTADTFRIAAAEQLRTYANILEVPFRVIYTEEELQNAIRDFKEYDYVFVDTSGHSHQNKEQIGRMKSLIHAVNELAEKQVFLVLSATTKYRDLLQITDCYKELTDFQLIFTKLDETTSVGNLLNLKMYADASIAYVTCGQNVPDDIEFFNPQKTVKQLLGGKKS